MLRSRSSFDQARASLITDLPPDVFIVDVRLGMFNGLQLMQLAKQIRSSITVVTVSGFDDPVSSDELKRRFRPLRWRPESPP